MNILRILAFCAAFMAAQNGYAQTHLPTAPPAEKNQSQKPELDAIRNELTAFLRLCFTPDKTFYWSLADDSLAQLLYSCEWKGIRVWGYAAYPVIRHDADVLSESELAPNEQILEAHGTMFRVIIDRSRLISYGVSYEVTRPSYITSQMGGVDIYLEFMRLLPEIILCGLDFGKYNKPEEQFPCTISPDNETSK